MRVGGFPYSSLAGTFVSYEREQTHSGREEWGPVTKGTGSQNGSVGGDYDDDADDCAGDSRCDIAGSATDSLENGAIGLANRWLERRGDLFGP